MISVQERVIRGAGALDGHGADDEGDVESRAIETVRDVLHLVAVNYGAAVAGDLVELAARLFEDDLRAGLEVAA